MNAEKHCNTKIPMNIETLRCLWDGIDSDRVRMEIVKSLIYTAADDYDFREKVVKEIQSEKFINSLG